MLDNQLRQFDGAIRSFRMSARSIVLAVPDSAGDLQPPSVATARHQHTTAIDVTSLIACEKMCSECYFRQALNTESSQLQQGRQNFTEAGTPAPLLFMASTRSYCDFLVLPIAEGKHSGRTKVNPNMGQTLSNRKNNRVPVHYRLNLSTIRKPRNSAAGCCADKRTGHGSGYR